MAERLASMTDGDKARFWSDHKSVYIPAIWAVPLVLVIAWAFSWFLMGTIWFGFIASILMLFVVIVIINRLLKAKKDIGDGRKRIVTGVVSDQKIKFNENEAKFEFDDNNEMLSIEASYKSSNSRTYTFKQNLPYKWPKEVQEDASLSYVLRIDDISYRVPREVFVSYRMGMEFEGSFTFSGVYIP